MEYPSVDPIPLPAPVWLMKALGLLTLALHFTALMLLVGGLFLVVVLSSRHRDAALAIARKLPTTMTYVLNLGVPPLLFAQVLYGRALYTSSVLMAALWIGVIPLTMGCYFHLYRTVDRLAAGRSGLVPALVALLLAMGVGQMFSFNMTLMLRPEVWPAMYAHTATGLQAPPHDPTATPRWMFLMVGGIAFGGVLALLVSHQKGLAEAAQATLRRVGGIVATVALLGQAGLAFAVHATQPAIVQQGLAAGALYTVSAGLFGVGALLALALSAVHIGGKRPLALSIGAALGGFVANAGAVLYRDGIRDLTLKAKGFDVWDRTVVSNWSVIAIFFVLFVAGLGIVGWLIRVAALAKPIETEVSA